MSLRINGLTPTQMGLTVADLAGWADGPSTSRGFVPRPGAFGGFASDLESVAPRTMRIVGLVTGQTVATRDAALSTVMQNLEGTLEVEFDDSPNKVMICRLSSVTTAGVVSQSFVVSDLRVTIDLVAVQGVKLDKYSSIVRCKASTANDGILVGTAPTLGRIWVHNATNPVFTLSDFRGNSVESLTLTATIGAAESVLIDLYTQAIYDVDTEVTFTRNDAYLTAGDFFEVKPEYADRANSVWPKLSVSSGEGWFEFRRAWRS